MVAEVRLTFTAASDAHVTSPVLAGPSRLQPLNSARCAVVHTGSQQQSKSQAFAVRSQTQVPMSVLAVMAAGAVVTTEL
jgi:hypothetical protein